MFFGRTDAEAETPILWPSHVKSWLNGKDPDAGRNWGQEEKGTAEDEVAEWHHRLDGHEFEWTLGIGDGQGGLVCCDSWVAKSWTQLSDWTELNELPYGELLWASLVAQRVKRLPPMRETFICVIFLNIAVVFTFWYFLWKTPYFTFLIHYPLYNFLRVGSLGHEKSCEY